MKRLNTIFISILVLCIICVSALVPSQAAATEKNIMWKMQAYFASAGKDPTPMAVVRFAERVKERSGGRLAIHVYWAGELGIKPADYLKAVKNRAIQLAVTFDGYYSNEIEATSIGNLLWAGANYSDARRLAKEVLLNAYNKSLERYGASVLWMQPTTTNSSFWAKPVDDYFQLKGRKMRVYSPECAEYFEKLGGIGVFIPWGEVYPSLEKGVVDGWFSGVTHLGPRSLYEVTKYWTNDFFMSGYYLWIMNREAFAELPPDLQKIVKEEADGVVEEFWKDVNRLEKENWELAREKGMREIKLPPGSDQRIREIFQKQLIPKWREKYSPEGKALLSESMKVMGWQ
jgi:TRAP-type C4-dicarboxylate transport system substrate-binding protein